ncbi:MAG: hypothetical protein L3J65_12300 [Robiginitomaculum sp.]|nr:hypothetical protein [Robiginitomaculum sp.]
MQCYDVFNGDADGICALVQLRLNDAEMNDAENADGVEARPDETVLVTGVKRDINLLDRVTAKDGDIVTVLDISMRTNADDVRRLLAANANIFYVDHHNPGDIPKHGNLHAIIDTKPNTCTSLLVDDWLEGAYRAWAVVAAFGDNLADAAIAAARTLDISADKLAKLKSLGELINYNAYGRDISDLHFTPKHLYQQCVQYKTPGAFLLGKPEIFEKLETGYAEDMRRARNCGFAAPCVSILDDAPWARRISGSYGNILSVENPAQAHAVLTHNGNDGYLISVRAPKANPHGADKFCLKFPTGGGRTAAAGINHLPKCELDSFLAVFGKAF